MTRPGLHISGGLDPVNLAAQIGLNPDPWQAQVLREPHQRELLVVHRQGGKSVTAAVAAVHAALYEKALILVVSPSQRQSQELFRTILQLYRSLGRPVPSESENQLSVVLENGSRVVALPADAITIRGYSAAKLLIIDEGAFVSDETIAAVRPMLAVSNGRMLAMSTPFGRRGWFYEASRSREWRVTKVLAEQCPRITKEFLEGERTGMGEWRYRQEYECEFVDVAGLMFRTDDIDAIFAGPGPELATGNGEGLFGTPLPRRALPAPRPTRPRTRFCAGHLWRDGQCVRCGFPQPVLAAAGGE
ncbi:MAG: terminase large subunit domain-containing protein [Candidatus Dormibacteraceae bacterium]